MTGFIGVLHRHDERLLHYLVLRRYRLLDGYMRKVTRLADPAPAVVMALLLPDRRGLWALILSHIAVQLLKRSCCRARPAMPAGVEALTHAPDRFSFPSGHAAAGMSIAIALAALLAPPLAAVVVALAVTVGISRCYLGVHFPGDVAAGWTLAALAYGLSGSLL